MKETTTVEEGVGANDDVKHVIKTLSADMVRIALVETRLFGHTLLAMIGLTMLIALLLVSGWLYIGAALAIALAELEAFNLPGALLMVALIHLLILALAFWRRRRIARDLSFRESRASVSSLLIHAQAVAEAVAFDAAADAAAARRERREKSGSEQATPERATPREARAAQTSAAHTRENQSDSRQ